MRRGNLTYILGNGPRLDSRPGLRRNDARCLRDYDGPTVVVTATRGRPRPSRSRTVGLAAHLPTTVEAVEPVKL